jgi:hypothetical protein
VIWVNLDQSVGSAVDKQILTPALPAQGTGAGVSPVPELPAADSPVCPVRPKSEKRVDFRTVVVTGGNLRNNHIYLPLDFFPDDAVGGKNKADLAPRTISVSFQPGQVVQTDIDGSKRILRVRPAVGDFLGRAGVAEGDSVRIERTGPYAYSFSKATL